MHSSVVGFVGVMNPVRVVIHVMRMGCVCVVVSHNIRRDNYRGWQGL